VIKKLLSILIPLAIMATAINDGGYYLATKYTLAQTTAAAAQTAADAAPRNKSDPNITWQTAQSYAQKNGADVYGFELKGGVVYVWTKQPVEHLWLLSYIAAVTARQPLKTPLYLDDDGSAVIQ
jgi:hypothetical protein